MVRALSLLCALSMVVVCAPADAQERLGRLTLEQAVDLALRENPTLRAKGFEVQSTRAGEITAGLIPNPTGSYTSEKYGAGGNTVIEHTATLGQTLELGTE